jgi:hypothetical protein
MPRDISITFDVYHAFQRPWPIVPVPLPYYRLQNTVYFCLITASAEITVFSRRTKILRSEQNFGTTPTHELVCICARCLVAICENLKWFAGRPSFPRVARPTALEWSKIELALDRMGPLWAKEKKFKGSSKLSSPINSLFYKIYCSKCFGNFGHLATLPPQLEADIFIVSLIWLVFKPDIVALVSAVHISRAKAALGSCNYPKECKSYRSQGDAIKTSAILVIPQAYLQPDSYAICGQNRRTERYSRFNHGGKSVRTPWAPASGTCSA